MKDKVPSTSQPPEHQSAVTAHTVLSATPISPETTPNTAQVRRKGPRFLRSLILVVVCIAAGFFGSWLGAMYLAPTSGQRALQGISADFDGNSVLTSDEENVTAVAEKVGPSVVSILTTTSSRGLFAQIEQGAGTGIIVSEDGYVMTNRHVIEGARDVSVITSDGKSYDDVRIIGNDPLNDIAFIKINDVADLTPATLGDSGSVRMGQRVIAFGNALGQYQNTVTSGIISGTGRPIIAASEDGSGAEALTDLIQTDAAINSGNSGGPLVNAAGQVIGINTAVATDANGIGFAIPINATKGILQSVLEKGQVEKAYLGVQFNEVTPDVASEYDLGVNRGAYVHSERGQAVASNGPADRAGIKRGDIIMKINDDIVGEHGSLSSLIGQYRPGDAVSVEYRRDDDTRTARITLGSYQAAAAGDR